MGVVVRPAEDEVGLDLGRVEGGPGTRVCGGGNARLLMRPLMLDWLWSSCQPEL